MDPQPWSKAQPHRILRHSGAANSATTRATSRSRSGRSGPSALSLLLGNVIKKLGFSSGLLRSVSQLQVDLVTRDVTELQCIIHGIYWNIAFEYPVVHHHLRFPGYTVTPLVSWMNAMCGQWGGLWLPFVLENSIFYPLKKPNMKIYVMKCI